MIAQLTGTERVNAALLLFAIIAIGLVMTLSGDSGDFRFHGLVIMSYATVVLLLLTGGAHSPMPTSDRFAKYYDDPSKVGILVSMTWLIIGLFVGDWVAWLLVFPDLTFDVEWFSFGRLRPVHTTSVIFGFGGNALIATSFHVMQRTCRARLSDQFSPWFVIFGYNLFCLLAVTGYLAGITQSKEYAEPEWYTDLVLLIVWIVYLLLYLRTLARRSEPHIYVANWYYLAFILVVGVLHVVNNLAVPISLMDVKSYSLFSGVQDAMTQWWYGHNAVAFFLTSGFLGMMYYYLPKRAGRPI
jgi:cytochrome c oxidase cbb3-type subunit 1